MLMVVVGAGASFDSYEANVKGYPEIRPPLASQLFDERDIFRKWMATYEECGIVIPELRREAKEGRIEECFESLIQRANVDDDLHLALNALRFYIQRSLFENETAWLNQTGRATNYGSLVGALREWAAASGDNSYFVVTFNYDTLIDRALTAAYPYFVTYNTIDDWVSYVDAKLFKLHGSVDWVQPIGQVVENERQIIQLGSRVQPFTDEYYRVGVGTYSWTYPDGKVVSAWPAVALPTTKKQRFICPPKHVERLQGLLSQVDRVLTVGWRASEQEFLNLWTLSSSSDHEIHVVTGSKRGVTDVEANLSSGGVAGKVVGYPIGFSEFISGGYMKALLS